MARDQFTELLRRVADLERRINNIVRWGRITEVDEKKGTARVAYALDPDGKDVVSYKLPWQAQAGVIREWKPPSKNQQVLVFFPGGDPGLNGLIMPGTYSETYPQPDDKKDRHVMMVGGVDENGNKDPKNRKYQAIDNESGIHNFVPKSCQIKDDCGTRYTKKNTGYTPAVYADVTPDTETA